VNERGDILTQKKCLRVCNDRSATVKPSLNKTSNDSSLVPPLKASVKIRCRWPSRVLSHCEADIAMQWQVY